ncbi:hypothetical protein Tco_0869092, partial [Tanacetum coccineum]
PQKNKSRRKQRKDNAPTKPTTEETTLEEHVSTPSYDPPPSGVDRMLLAELMSLCTNLQEKGKIQTGEEIEFEKVVEEHVVSVATTTKSIPVSVAEVVTTASASVVIPDELTLAQTLIEIKTTKPKHVTTAATTVTSVRPRAKGIIFHDQEEHIKLLLMKKWLEILKAQLQAKLIKEERLARQKEEEANIALIKSWDNIQAMMEVDFELAQRLQAKEQGEINIEERSRLFNLAGYKHSQLKNKSYDEIQKLFDKEMKSVNTFVDMNSKVVKGSETITEESSKRAGDELESDMLKKQKIDEHVEVEKDDQEEEEMKRHIEIVKDDEVAIDAIPLATKPPVIVEYQIDKDGRI